MKNKTVLRTLIINTTNPEELLVGAARGAQYVVYTRHALRGLKDREKLLFHIDAVLKKARMAKSKLAGVIVVRGPGRFTATRVGVTVANAIGFALGIPVIGVKATEFSSPRALRAKGLARLTLATRDAYVVPFYDKKPNITLPKLSMHH